MVRLLLLLSLLLPLSSCARPGSREAGPVSAIGRWIEATDKDDAPAAYALLNKGTRERMEYASFLKRWSATKRERVSQIKAMRAALATGGSVAERAQVGRSAEHGAYLVREKAGWRLDAPLLSSVHTPKPHDALAYLTKAVRESSVDQLLRIMSAPAQERLEGLISDFLAGLMENEGAEVQVSGHVAMLEWKDDKGTWRIKLVLENGQWRIDDVFPPR